MHDFRFYQPIDVRYGDLDPQGHVNNAKYMTYLEQARINYVRHLGLFESHSFMDLGIILADIQLTFRRPILFGQEVRVGVSVSRLGNKSLTMEYRIEDTRSGEELAGGTSVLVAYDYRTSQTIPIPDKWRQTIAGFENISTSS